MDKLLYKGTTKNRPLPRIFTKEEISSFISQILKSETYYKRKGEYRSNGDFYRIRDACLIATIYLLGLRPSEACSLMFKDFDFDKMFVRIRYNTNKAHKERVIPIPEQLIIMFKEYLKFPKNRYWINNPYIFPSLVPEKHITPERLKYIFREKVLKPLGLWESPNFGSTVSPTRLYSLRHSRASHILNKQIENNGIVDIFSIANFLGHADIRSTQVYMHTDNQYNEYLRYQTKI